MEYVAGVMKGKDPKIEVFDLLGDYYDEWFEGKGKFIFESELLLFKSIKHYIKSPSVEIGSGSGRFSKELNIDFAIEPSEKLREISIKRGIIPIAARGEDVPFDSGIFETVLIIVSLCFFSKPKLVLRESYRILKEDGHLILGLVLKNSPWGILYRKKKEEGHPFYREAKFYTLDMLEKMLDIVGFEIHDIYSTLVVPPSKIQEVHKPVHGYNKDAGFVGIVARKVRR